ncbi:MAG: hypothetical protein Kow0068_05770 [Marinilabiliales bacterium]
MKTKLFTFLMILAVTLSYSQLVTITETNQIPQIGDTIHYIDLNTFGFDAAGTGAVTDKLWDFSSLMDAGTTVDFWYVDASTTPQASNYPNANIARENSQEAGYFYYECTGSDWFRWGWYAGATNFGIYNTGANEFHFPITAGNNYNSSYEGTFAPFNLGEDSVRIEQGQIIAEADMQGTLILPNGATLNNVLRIHLIESFHIVTYMFGTPAMDNVMEDDYYYWFHDSILQPVLVYGTTDLDGQQQSEVLRYQPVNIVTGKYDNNFADNTLIYPNPTSGIVNISSDLYKTVEIFNIYGQKINAMKAKSTLDLSFLTSGHYILILKGDADTRVIKLEIFK